MSIPRQRHVQRMLAANPSLKERGPGIYELGLKSSSGVIFTLRVYLPPRFPDVAPEVSILDTGATHEWLGHDGRVVGCNSLYAWTPHNDLGALVNEIVRQFCVRPPRQQHQQHQQQQQQHHQQGSGSMPPPYLPTSSSNTMQHNQQRQPMRSPVNVSSYTNNNSNTSNINSDNNNTSNNDEDDGGIEVAPVPTSFPELDNKSPEELKHLLDDSKSFKEFFNELDPVENICTLRDQLRSNNVETAKANLSKQDELDMLAAQVHSMESSVAESRKEHQALVGQLKSKSRSYEPAVLLKELTALCSQVDEASEDSLALFMEGDSNVTAFVKQYRDLRTLFHLRQSKAEHLKAQIGK